MEQDSSTFGTKGQQDEILPRDGMGWDSLSKSGTGCGTGQDLVRVGMQEGMGQALFFPIIFLQ